MIQVLHKHWLPGRHWKARVTWLGAVSLTWPTSLAWSFTPCRVYAVCVYACTSLWWCAVSTVLPLVPNFFGGCLAISEENIALSFSRYHSCLLSSISDFRIYLNSCIHAKKGGRWQQLPPCHQIRQSTSQISHQHVSLNAKRLTSLQWYNIQCWQLVMLSVFFLIIKWILRFFLRGHRGAVSVFS